MTTAELHNELRCYYNSGATQSIRFRKHQLRALKHAIIEYEGQFYRALEQDLNKSSDEAFLTEINIVLNEINYALRHVRFWAKKRYVCGSMLTFPSVSYIQNEPIGTVLIMAPWNYPVNLLLCPLVGAIAAGCTVMLKPSPTVPNVSRVLSKMINSTFSSQYITIVEGHRDVNQELLALRWDTIFFTGSPRLGRIVMEAASKHLTPCILELGGKSPCIIDKDANIKVTARRVAWGKLLNNGQTCIAPDYLMVHHSIVDTFMHELDEAIEDISENNQIVRIVNDDALHRLESYEQNQDLQWEEEIFGPMFPVRTYSSLQDAVSYINNHEKPLALYFFGQIERGKFVIDHTSSGGAVINDVMLHIVNPNLPFGGVGNSGMGSYHRKQSYLCFTHRKSVLVAWNPFRIRLKELPFTGKSRFLQFVCRIIRHG